jgi:hypothetical protein
MFRSRLLGSATVVGYSLAVEFVWLSFAQFSKLWVPYNFYPL